MTDLETAYGGYFDLEQRRRIMASAVGGLVLLAGIVVALQVIHAAGLRGLEHKLSAAT